LPKTDRLKFQVLQWLMFQMGGVGPMIGQTHHFRQYAPEKIDYAINRYTNETKRLYGVMNKQLAGSKFIACDEYSIADIAIFPWLRNWENHGIDWADYPHLKKWFDLISERPAVQRGVKVLAELRKPITDDKAREVLFGKTQYRRTAGRPAGWLKSADLRAVAGDDDFVVRAVFLQRDHGELHVIGVVFYQQHGGSGHFCLPPWSLWP
jgi:hypothetical protein